MSELLRVLLVGHGRMGRLVESLAAEYNVEIAGVVTRGSAAGIDAVPAADVAIDFSTTDAVPINAPRLAARGVSLVIGTTGWQASEAGVKESVAGLPVGVIAAPNFAIGVNLFAALAATAGRLLAERGFDAWLHEWHHAAKKDAPSGTALSLERALLSGGAWPPIGISSTRAGHIPGTHAIGFDAPSEAITLTHEARDRTPFARGALQAARWIHGRRGWFTMADMLNLSEQDRS